MKFFRPTTIKIHQKITLFIKEVCFSFTLVAFVALCPTIAHAGFLSFFSNIASTPASADTITPSNSQNSQTMSLPIPATSVVPVDASLADDGLQVSGNSITAEVGPSGTTADVDQLSSTQISTYVVRSGDTLSEIAAIFNVSVNTILWANDLTSQSKITEGDTLIILPMSGIQYTVRKGDTLQGIVKKYNADVNDVLQYNNITLDSALTVGETILIPDAEFGTPQGGSGEVSVSNSITTPKRSGGKGIPPRSQWGAPGTEPAHNTGGPNYDSDYILPVARATETQDIHGYNAVDLAAPTGTTIVASDSGKVIIARTGGWNGGYGNYVVISHDNGTQTLYAHMSKVIAYAGEEVAQGQKIGLVGQTGEATGPHVHFEVRGAHNPFAGEYMKVITR